MSWTIGDLITATKLNSDNPTYGLLSGTLSSGADNIQDSIGNSGIIYSHRANGSPLFTVRLDCGLFGGGQLIVQKLINGNWSTNYDTTFGWNTHQDVTVNSTGPGSYHIYSGTAWQFDAAAWTVWFGQDDCNAGDYLVQWDNKFSSLNRISGNLLTASLLNTGYIGTEASL